MQNRNTWNSAYHNVYITSYSYLSTLTAEILSQRLKLKYKSYLLFPRSSCRFSLGYSNGLRCMFINEKVNIFILISFINHRPADIGRIRCNKLQLFISTASLSFSPLVWFAFNSDFQVVIHTHTTLKFLKWFNIPHDFFFTTHQQHSHCTFTYHGT